MVLGVSVSGEDGQMRGGINRLNDFSVTPPFMVEYDAST
jgi:hypothetical protein